MRNNIFNWMKLSSFIFALSSLFASCSNELDDTLQPVENGTLQFVIGDFPAFGEGAQTRAIGTQDEGKTAWENGDKILVTLISQKYGEQAVALTYNGSSWSTEASLSYLENETPTVSAVYAPGCKISKNNILLDDNQVYGMLEYIHAFTKIEGKTLRISFEGVERNYSRLRIAAMPIATLTVTTTGFTPAGPEGATAPQSYTLTTDDKGNAFLYGIFAEGATVSVKLGDVTLKDYTFTAEKNPNGTEQGKSYALDATPIINLTQYEDGATIDITYSSRIIGDGTEYNLSLNIAEDATVLFEEGTGGVKLNAISVADNKTLTLKVKGNVGHSVKEGISIGNGSYVIIEGERDKDNNKLIVTATDGNAAIGANNGVTAGDITIRNARMEATGSSTLVNSNNPVSGAAIGTSDANMGDILIENSIITATGSAHSTLLSFAAAIGSGSFCESIGNIVFVDSEITAKITDESLASVIGAGCRMHGERGLVGTMGDIVFTNTSLNLSIVQNLLSYGALIGNAEMTSYFTVNMGKIIFTDMTQAELDAMIATWTYPEDFAEWGAYIIGRGPNNILDEKGTIDGVYVSDGNGGTVQIGNADGYNPTGYVTDWGLQ